MHQTIRVELSFQQGYIADPYWPEREELINIQKASGVNRARSEQKRDEVLKEYLKRIGMTKESYEDLQRLAERPWYRHRMEEDAEIIIPSHQWYGCLIESAKACPASLRPCEPDNLRHIIQLSDLSTGKFKTDGIFKRLVMPKNGAGQPLSNQRALRMNPYISDVIAHGTLTYYPEDIREHGEYLEDFLAYAGHRVGVGASRKMGYGRFTVQSWEVS